MVVDISLLMVDGDTGTILHRSDKKSMDLGVDGYRNRLHNYVDSFCRSFDSGQRHTVIQIEGHCIDKPLNLF